MAEADSFGQAAREYERSRPDYPAAAVDWIVPTDARRALDLGAGTGKLTGLLLERELDVVAVEPSEEMRGVLAAKLPAVRALAGSAERIPLAADSVDLVTVAQAWHWVDERRALPEVARVLRPEGTLVLVWNFRDERVEWVRRLNEILQPTEPASLLDGGLTIPPPFGPTESREIRWSRTVDPEMLVEMARSLSYVIVAPERERVETLAAVRALAGSDPALAGRARFELPYRTICYRARLAG